MHYTNTHKLHTHPNKDSNSKNNNNIFLKNQREIWAWLQVCKNSTEKVEIELLRSLYRELWANLGYSKTLSQKQHKTFLRKQGVQNQRGLQRVLQDSWDLKIFVYIIILGTNLLHAFAGWLHFIFLFLLTLWHPRHPKSPP